MTLFTQSSLIKCSLEDLCDFHLDSNNIKKITPSNTKVELLDYTQGTYEGKIVKIKTTKFFLPMIWEVEIEKFDPPNILIDRAIHSPFKYWRHSHIFTQKGDLCELKDIIEFEVPFGIIGKFFEVFILKDIKNMFEYRHKKTKEIIESNLPRV
jgi:ligand-binding SRPBCC domain-containing protein